MPEELNLAMFQALVNTKFTVEVNESQTVELELVEVAMRNHDPKLESFSLFFRGAESPYLSQGMRSFSHEKLDKVQIFITPLGPKNGGMMYEAAFNRFLKDGK